MGILKTKTKNKQTKNMGVSLTQKQEKRRKGASKMFVSVVLQWKEDHALKLHRYHVRFQRFIRTSDHGNDAQGEKNPSFRMKFSSYQ